MYQSLGPFVKQPSDDAKIWRYMDIAKLVSILDRKELYFSNTRKAIDPYEGALAEYNKNYAVRLKRFAHLLQDLDDNMVKRLIAPKNLV